MAIQLSSSYLRRSFQLLAKLDSETISGDEAFERAGNVIYEWAKRKYAGIFKQLPYYKETLDDKRDGNEIGIIYDPKQSCFVFRVVHPDAKIPGRIWTTDAQISKANDEYVIAVRLSVTSLQCCNEDVPYSCPEFVRHIIDAIGVSDIKKISDKPTIISSQEEVVSFIDFLENPDRQMPVLLISPCYSPDDAFYDGYMVDTLQVAKALRGVAHVFCTTVDTNDYLRDRIGQWAPYNGAIRTYYPGLSFNESNLFHHPLLAPQNIRILRIRDEEESDSWIGDIEHRIQEYSVKRRVPWRENGIEFYLSEYQKRLREQRIASAQSQEELIALYEEQIEQIQKQSEENLHLADSYAKDYETESIENDHLRQLNNRLKSQITALRSQLDAICKGACDQEVPLDGSYHDMADWIEEYYSDRLRLHPRAVRSLKSACYEDVELVYKCLRLLATSYWGYRMGTIAYDSFLAECKSVDSGLEERGSITDVAAGMEGDTYYVQHCGKKRKLDRHLTKGSNKDRRYCLRIYFFWDEQEQTVVIGDMPHHLDTSAT